MTNHEAMKNDEIGERGRLARSFRRPAEKAPRVSREARDTAGEAPALPGFVIFARDSSISLGMTSWFVIRYIVRSTSRLVALTI